MNYLNVLAKALYDNVAESPDELSFRKGDIMTVLERNTQGLEGWWLCSLHGRQGIVPGNRLKILVGMYDKKQSSSDQGQQVQQQPQSQSQPQLQPQSQFQPPPTPMPYPHQGIYNMPSPASQYASMHPAYQTQGDNIYLIPAPNKPHQQSLYQNSQGAQSQSSSYQSPPTKQPALYQKQTPHHQIESQTQDIYQVPPALNPVQDVYQVPVGSISPPQDIYQFPSSTGLGQDIYQVPPSMTQSQDIYQVPPSMDKRNWESGQLPGKVVVPTRVGQIYVYDSSKTEQDEYDIPRHLLSLGTQEIYDVPPNRGTAVSQYSQEVHNTPVMAVKGSSSREQAWEIYDVPPVVEKKPQTHLMIYDIPPSVSKDVPDSPLREETYDIPPAFAKQKIFDSISPIPQIPPQHSSALEPYIPEDIYDMPPPAGKGTGMSFSQEIYDVPPSLKKNGGSTFSQDVYDFPREFHNGKVPAESDGDYIYDVPSQQDKEVKMMEELSSNLKRLSASSTGSTRSNISTSSLDTIPVKESSVILSRPPGKELSLDLDAAMDVLAKLQQIVLGSISYLMSFITSTWRSHEQMEANVQNIRSAVESVKKAVKDLLEFVHGAVINASQASDRTCMLILSRQFQKMEDVYQVLLKTANVLDNCDWDLNVLVTNKSNTTDDLDRFVMYSRGIPDDTKQLASFLHGNASLLFKRTKQKSLLVDSQSGLENAGQLANNNSSLSVHQMGHSEKTNIQSRPLPSPPKFLALDRQYENESGWMEDYDYVHLQGKEEFEKTQKELLEKGNIMRQGKVQLEQQQLKQFELLEQEVTQPIDHDLLNWTPPEHCVQTRSTLGPSDRQLLLFYLEQCEASVTTLNNAIDAFYSSISTNQPPKIFVAHSKFVILSAHKLVFIGDTLSRQAKAQDIRSKVTQYSNLLCEMLKGIVVTTKTAALQYPSPSAARDMVDRVNDLSNSTQQFRMALGQMAAM
ncbi:LOW QUALITY PROTEIN: breast cancer anti-estrogen resistance protein 1 [Microcaecilia unicolor]|uniref:Breast cancer anti-estrogen resistance protein 1 n=1 Tax=Microcaecilia unicolor TaxID=1415580 RepID=A0A6P7Y9P1_9AMPH|nr:LOW QUALITY PROTEIN: breast cancer anti-estrogen resistance protein 1 [Microcaecilia unicolor]